jgi:hypothetical protein
VDTNTLFVKLIVKVQQFSYFVSRILLEYISLLHFDPNDDEISQRVDVEVL